MENGDKKQLVECLALLLKMYIWSIYNDMVFWTGSWTGSNGFLIWTISFINRLDYIEVVLCYIEDMKRSFW